MNIENCKGCHTYEVTNRKCVTKSIITKRGDIELICPCSTCLVKSMCSYPCDEMKNFYHKIIKLCEEKD